MRLRSLNLLTSSLSRASTSFFLLSTTMSSPFIKWRMVFWATGECLGSHSKSSSSRIRGLACSMQNIFSQSKDASFRLATLPIIFMGCIIIRERLKR